MRIQYIMRSELYRIHVYHPRLFRRFEFRFLSPPPLLASNQAIRGRSWADVPVVVKSRALDYAFPFYSLQGGVSTGSVQADVLIPMVAATFSCSSAP